MFILLHVSVQSSQNHLLKGLFFFPLPVLVTLTENQPYINMWVCFWLLSSITWTHMSIMMLIPHFVYYCNFVVSFEVKKCDSSKFVLLFWACLRHLGRLYFHMNFRIILSIFYKEVRLDSTRLHTLNLYIALEIMATLSIPSVPIHQHGMLYIYLGLLNIFQQCLIVFRAHILHTCANLFLSILLFLMLS